MDDMENKTKMSEVSTKEEGRLLLSERDAAEYYAYKKQKKIAHIMGALARSEGVVDGKEDIKRVAEKAARIHQAAVRVTPTYFDLAKEYLSRGNVKVDCLIGGSGETLTKVKVYEARLMRRMGAKELTVAITPSWLDGRRYAEIKKELRRLMRVMKNTYVKVWVGGDYPYATVARVGRIASEVGVKYLSIPYFVGCERLRYDLFGGCLLEVVGVNTLADFKKMIGAGVGRIVTSYGFDIYAQWMKEVEEVEVSPKTEGKQTGEETPLKFV
jgi:deoxyribose-phosphate aldolase